MTGEKKKEIWRVVKFVLFSASAGIIQIGLFTLLNELCKWSYWPCYLIALVASVVWNFTLNRKFTFKSANNVPKAMALVLCYYAVFTPLSTLLGNWLVETCGWNEYLVTVMNMLLNLPAGVFWYSVRMPVDLESGGNASARGMLLSSLWTVAARS